MNERTDQYEVKRQLHKERKNLTAKKAYINGIVSRLRPSVYEANDPIWGVLKNGLWKMNIENLMALEATIAGHITDNYTDH